MADFLDDAEIAMIREDIQDIVGNEYLGGTITYRSFASKGTFDPNLRRIGGSFNNYSINAAGRSMTIMEIDESAGFYQKGDYIYTVAYEDLTEPKKDDQIIDGSRTRRVFDFSTDSIQTFHSIVCRDV